MRHLLCVGMLLLTGCASSFKKQFYQSMAAGAAAGALYGASKPENRSAYMTMWAGVGAAAGAAFAVYQNDPDEEANRLRAETARVKAELDRLHDPKIEAQTSAFFGSKVPEKYRALINPGEWRVSKIDQWVEDDENRLIHQDLVMELVPPSLNPVSRPTQKKEKP